MERTDASRGPQTHELSPAEHRPLSVLLVNSLYTPFVVGGAEVVTEMLATTLAAQGHKVSVVTSCSRDHDFVRERLNGVEIYRFFPPNKWWLYERFAAGDRRSVLDKLRWRVADAWNRDVAEMFGDILEEARPDVVHTHNIKGLSPVVWHRASQAGIPVVHTAHSYELICADGALTKPDGTRCAPSSRCMLCRVHGAWYSAQAASIDMLCSPSEYLVQAHVEAGMRPTRTAIVRNAVPRPSIAVPSRPAADDRTRFLYLGQLSSHKGVHTLIEAIGLASPANFRIDIAGRGDAEGAVAKLAARDGRVHYHGFVDGERKKRLLASADVLIFPSVWVENAPMSIAEAFCNGLAVIGSKLGAIPEFVADGVNGMLFGPGNAAALALRMMHLVERPADLRRLKDGARSQGEAWPTPQAMALAYTQIYRSVLRSRAAPSTAEPAGMSTLRSILGETR